MDNSWISVRFAEALDAHHDAGYPALSEKEQAELLLGKNPETIPALPKGLGLDFLPAMLMKHYIFLSRASFRPYFVASDYIERSIQAHKSSPYTDGDYVVPQPKGRYKIIYQERGCTQFEEYIENHDLLVDNLINKLFQNYNLQG